MNEQFVTLANRVARSSVAVVDTMTQRGAIKGEELATLGGLRDQCVKLIQMVEQIQSEEQTHVVEPNEETGSGDTE